MALPWGGQSHSSHLKWTSRYATSRWSWLYRWNLTWNESITTYQWPSSVISDNLFGLTWKRESDVDVQGYCTTGLTCPLLGRGSALLSFGPSHEETERGLPDGAGREHIFGLSQSSQGNVRPYEMPPQSHDASYTGLTFLPSVSLFPSTVDILSSCS